MPYEALLPCLICGKRLPSVAINGYENQPYGGTVFATYGNYGSTFWDDFDGEELVLNVCDDCLRERSARLGQHKRFLPVFCEGMTGFGRQWVDRPVVTYTGNKDDTRAYVEREELGVLPGVDWVDDIVERREWLGTED
jgi:hypothetical protein